MKEIKISFYANVDEDSLAEVKRALSKYGAEVITDNFEELENVGCFEIEEDPMTSGKNNIEYRLTCTLRIKGEIKMIPTYNEDNNEWEVEAVWNGRRVYDSGDLLSIMETFSHSGLYYPYKTKDSKQIDDWEDHCHSFDDLLHVIAEEYDSFSITGYEDHYSKQEQEFIQKILTAYKNT